MCRRVLKCSMIHHKAMFPVVVFQGRCTKKHDARVACEQARSRVLARLVSLAQIGELARRLDARVELLFWLLDPLLL